MYKLNNFIVFILFFFITSVYAAGNTESIKKQTKAVNYLTAKEAYALKKKQGEDLLLVDIRTPSELLFIGIPKNMDVNIPLVTIDYQQWDEKESSFKKIPNKDFMNNINAVIKSRGLTKKSTIMLICRSGKRSEKAANLLSIDGYTKVYSIVDGFEGDKEKEGVNKGKRVVNGWKNSGLPWTYKLNRASVNIAK